MYRGKDWLYVDEGEQEQKKQSCGQLYCVSSGILCWLSSEQIANDGGKPLRLPRKVCDLSSHQSRLRSLQCKRLEKTPLANRHSAVAEGSSR